MADSPVPSECSSLEEHESEERESLEGSPLNISDSDLAKSLEEVDHACGLCSERLQQPRVLSCLHVFCTRCLEKQVEEEEGSEDLLGCDPFTTPIATPPNTPAGTIVCSVCKQETKLHGKGVEDLPVDVVLSQMLDKDGDGEIEIICTSCKARENAVARCSDCANFLCPACVTAHQYMRCFENHKVRKLIKLRLLRFPLTRLTVCWHLAPGQCSVDTERQLNASSGIFS